MSRDCCVALPHDATGLSAVCDCGISWPYSLKPHSHCADVATVHPDAGQPVYRDAPGHIS